MVLVVETERVVELPRRRERDWARLTIFSGAFYPDDVLVFNCIYMVSGALGKRVDLLVFCSERFVKSSGYR